MGVTQVFSNSRVFVFLNALKKVSASIANIIHITQITFEFIDNAIIIITLFKCHMYHAIETIDIT